MFYSEFISIYNSYFCHGKTLKFIYSEKAKKFEEIFVAFSENLNFNKNWRNVLRNSKKLNKDVSLDNISTQFKLFWFLTLVLKLQFRRNI